MKKLPFGMQSFRKIIDGDYVYVDKTRFVYKLINDSSYYFLSRPRRFGKSLLLDTINEVFNGDRDIFKGLFIYESDYSFTKHPVLRLDMGSVSSESPELLKESLATALRERANEENLNVAGVTPSDIFRYLIKALSKEHGQSVVVLIDEYDKPMLDHLDDNDMAASILSVLRNFYGILKSMEPFLRLTFITGVTKFTKTSIFSGLNNLRDITLSREYTSICGIAIEDLGKYFSEHIGHVAAMDGLNRYENISNEILAWYDGYSWDGEARVINPYSLLGFFTEGKFSSFWYASGTPRFLMDLIKKDPSIYTNLKNLKMTELMLDTADIDAIEAETLLFQTGYLTVKKISHEMDEDIYILDLPNSEVRKAFNLHVAAAFTGKGQPRVKEAQLETNVALHKGDMHRILEILRSLFASIPYQLHVDLEAYYHSIFYAVMNILGFEIDAEVSVSGGRVDAVLELDDKVYVFEFKYSHCKPDTPHDVKQKLFEKILGEGMEQIRDRGYSKRYLGSGKEVIQAVFAFIGKADIEMLVG